MGQVSLVLAGLCQSANNLTIPYRRALQYSLDHLVLDKPTCFRHCDDGWPANLCRIARRETRIMARKRELRAAEARSTSRLMLNRDLCPDKSSPTHPSSSKNPAEWVRGPLTPNIAKLSYRRCIWRFLRGSKHARVLGRQSKEQLPARLKKFASLVAGVRQQSVQLYEEVPELVGRKDLQSDDGHMVVPARRLLAHAGYMAPDEQGLRVPAELLRQRGAPSDTRAGPTIDHLIIRILSTCNVPAPAPFVKLDTFIQHRIGR